MSEQKNKKVRDITDRDRKTAELIGSIVGNYFLQLREETHIPIEMVSLIALHEAMCSISAFHEAAYLPWAQVRPGSEPHFLEIDDEARKMATHVFNENYDQYRQKGVNPFAASYRSSLDLVKQTIVEMLGFYETVSKDKSEEGGDQPSDQLQELSPNDLFDRVQDQVREILAKKMNLN